MQHSGIVGMKGIQPLGQKPDDLAFGNLDTNIFEQGHQTLGRDLSMACVASGRSAAGWRRSRPLHLLAAAQ